MIYLIKCELVADWKIHAQFVVEGRNPSGARKEAAKRFNKFILCGGNTPLMDIRTAVVEKFK